MPIISKTLSADAKNREQVTASLIADIGNLPIDKVYEVEIAEQTRSKNQNRYLWGVCYRTIVEHMREHHGRDYSDEAIHETLKELFLFSRVEVMARGKEVKIYKTTTKLTKKEFAEYIEHIFRWAAEFGCVIHSPEWDYQ